MQTLINTIVELKLFITVDATVNIDSVAPYLAASERRFIMPILGSSVYNTLLANYQAGYNTMSADDKALWQEVNLANAAMAWLLYAPQANVRMTEAGIITTSTTETTQATKWMFNELILSLKEQAYAAIDTLCQYLELGITADWYIPWASSSAFANYFSLFVNQVGILSQYAWINNSRWIFSMLQPHLQRAEQTYAAQWIGVPFFNDLKAKYQAGTLTTLEQQAVAQIQNICSLYAYSMAIQDPNFRQETITVLGSRMDGINATGSNRADVDNRTAFGRVAEQYANQANNFCEQLQEFLNANASDTIFPLYFASTIYIDPTTPYIPPAYNNDMSTGTFFFA
jgi:hypothetical protein